MIKVFDPMGNKINDKIDYGLIQESLARVPPIPNKDSKTYEKDLRKIHYTMTSNLWIYSNYYDASVFYDNKTTTIFTGSPSVYEVLLYVADHVPPEISTEIKGKL